MKKKMRYIKKADGTDMWVDMNEVAVFHGKTSINPMKLELKNGNIISIKDYHDFSSDFTEAE